MPEIQYYTVTQTREVKVSAQSALDAARIASLAFSITNGSVDSEKGFVNDSVMVTDLNISKEL